MKHASIKPDKFPGLGNSFSFAQSLSSNYLKPGLTRKNSKSGKLVKGLVWLFEL